MRSSDEARHPFKKEARTMPHTDVAPERSPKILNSKAIRVKGLQFRV